MQSETMRKEFVLPRVFNPGAPNQDLGSRLLVGYAPLRLGTQRPLTTIRQKVSFVIFNVRSRLYLNESHCTHSTEVQIDPTRASFIAGLSIQQPNTSLEDRALPP